MCSESIHFCSAFCECNKHLSIYSASCFQGKSYGNAWFNQNCHWILLVKKKPRCCCFVLLCPHQMTEVQIQAVVLLVTLLMRVEWLQIECNSTEIFWGCKTFQNTHTDSHLRINTQAQTHTRALWWTLFRKGNYHSPFSRPAFLMHCFV